jgi:class 3 adenylate cyclase
MLARALEEENVMSTIDPALKDRHVTVTSFIHGPFMIVVTDPTNPKDDAYPQVVAPDGGYATKEAALDFIAQFATRKTPYLGLHFAVVQRSSENDFGRFCSWED